MRKLIKTHSDGIQIRGDGDLDLRSFTELEIIPLKWRPVFATLSGFISEEEAKLTKEKVSAYRFWFIYVPSLDEFFGVLVSASTAQQQPIPHCVNRMTIDPIDVGHYRVAAWSFIGIGGSFTLPSVIPESDFMEMKIGA